MSNRSPRSRGFPQWITASMRSRPQLVTLPALLLCTPHIAADSPLQTQAFGNLHDSRMTRQFPALDALMVGTSSGSAGCWIGIWPAGSRDPVART